ncbi:MAG TPA: cytochrome c oxidase subunit II [Acidobacteriaceae bacterium]|jgi:cytochrome c oxidase subunit 2|nr:cytochrome c oxidase subunit II [Acidobacteriaceae bacterium]
MNALSILAAVPGFSGNQTALNPAGPMAQRIEHTFSLIFFITAIVYVLTMIAVAISVWSNRISSTDFPPPEQSSPENNRKAVSAVAGAMAISILLLFVMMIASFATSHAIGKENGRAPIEVDVYGHQWWWEVQYPQPEADKMVLTANEIHIPTGSLVRIHGTSMDVIHSFWAPNIHGKRDLLPGYENDFVIQADQPGRWRGQCAEFCGPQHAHMSFLVIAEPMDQFHNWMTAQAGTPPPPATPQTQHGQVVFLSRACIMCHTVRGTVAGSRVGPDLTHVGSRDTIASGTLPNDAEHLARWISNAQQIKPGVRMPPNPMPQQDLNDLVAYLESLR